MIARLSFILHFALFSSVVPPLQAQVVEKGIDSAQRLDAIAGLRQDDRVRLAVANLGTLEGRFLRSSDGSVYLLADQGESGVPIGRIDELLVRGRATKRGFAIGAIGGAIVGGLFIGWAAAFGNSTNGGTDSNASVPLAVIGGAFFGGIVFGGIGAGIGALSSQWHCKYPR